MPDADRMLPRPRRAPTSSPPPAFIPHPRGTVAVLACMDTRIDLYAILGLERREAHISATPAASSPTTRSARWARRSAC